MSDPTFPMRRTCPFSPPPEYAKLREEGPLVRATLWNGRSTWLITRYAEARELLQDNRLSMEPHRLASLAESEEGTAEGFRTIVGMDPPEHGVYRRMLTADFTVKRVREMRPELEQVVGELVDKMVANGGPVDINEALALPLATQVICQLLGVPYADRDFFHSRSSVAVQSATSEQTQTAFMELYTYLDELVTKKEADPDDDGLISRLVVEQRRTGALTHEELVHTSLLLLIVGHETSANMVGLGVLTLINEPDVVRQALENPELWPKVVDELLRFHSSGDWLRRAAKEDIQVGDTLIKAGDSVIALAAAANRDERAFERADSFDIHRTERHHMAFGFGPHHCIGQHLAKAELELAYRALFERIPGLRLAGDLDDLPFKHDATLFGLHALPVTW